MNSNLRFFFILICFLLFGEQIVEGIKVECEYGDLWSFGYYYCKLRTQNISGFEAVTEVTGIHKAGKINEDVKYIDFNRMNFDRMPKDLNKFFTNVESLFLPVTGIKTLLKEDLDKFPKLRTLSAGNNGLESLQSDLFEGNSNLEEISFNNNKLKSIGSNLLKPLTKLKLVYFGGNPCIDKDAITKTQIEELKKELIAKCPPSPEMLQSQISSTLDQIEILKAENSRLKAELAASLELLSTDRFSVFRQLSSCLTDLKTACNQL